MSQADNRTQLYYHPRPEDSPRLVKSLLKELAHRRQWNDRWEGINGPIRDAVYAFERIGTPALPTLRAGLRHSNPFVRLAMAEALTRIDARSTVGLDALCRMLRHSKEVIREGAASCFSELTHQGKMALPVLCKMARRAKGSTRAHALVAIGGVGVKTSAAQTVVKEGLRDSDHKVRESALSAAVSLRLKTAQVIRMLVEQLTDRRESSAAAASLARLGPIPNLPVLPLRHAFAHDNPAYRTSILHTVWLCRLPTKQALPLLQAGMADPEPGVRHIALYALRELKPTNQTVVDLMSNATRDPAPKVRSIAVWGLVDIAPRKKVLPILARMVMDPEPEDRAASIAAMTKLGRVTRVLASHVVGAANDRDLRVRVSAAYAIGQLQLTGPSVVRALVKLLQDDDLEVRCHAAVALANLGRKARSATRALKHTLGNDDPCVQQLAYDALKKIDPVAVQDVARPKSEE
jgi:HEAT repeat protein